jgi:2-keto-3-deoxy-6-phosphogluconate aldolase
LFNLNSVSAGTTVVAKSVNAIADTGTTFIIVPWAQAKTLHKALGGTYHSSNQMV